MKIINKSTPFSVCLLRIENAGTLAVESYDDGMKKGNVSFSMAGTPRCTSGRRATVPLPRGMADRRFRRDFLSWNKIIRSDPSWRIPFTLCHLVVTKKKIANFAPSP
jgi:hypothetical protein